MSTQEPPTLRHRPRRPSVSDTVTAAASATASALTVLWDELPHWRRDNHFIVRGYRPTSNSYWRSFLSLGYLHNEFVNIWTHLLGAVAFTLGGLFLRNVVAPRYESASDADVLVFACFFGGAFL